MTDENYVQQHARKRGISIPISSCDIGPRGTMYHFPNGDHKFVDGDRGPKEPQPEYGRPNPEFRITSNDDWRSRPIYRGGTT